MLGIDKIVYIREPGLYNRYNFDSVCSDPYKKPSVRGCDQMLHRTLSKIFRERCRTSGQIKELLRAPIKRNNKKSIFKQILRQEPAFADLFQKKNEFSLLWIAVLCCYQESAELLVRSGADVNELYELKTQEISKKSSLLHALLQMYPSEWNERFIGLLIDHGADLKARDSIGSTVLHTALRYDRVKLAEMLLEKGAKVNATDSDGVTPLHCAVLSKKADKLVPLLMRHGADMNKVGDRVGLKVLYYLARSPREHVGLAGALIEKGVSPRGDIVRLNCNQPIHEAVISGNIELVKLFLDHGVNVNARGLCGQSPLYAAICECKNPEMLLTLLKRGANINLKKSSSANALYDLILYHKLSYKSTARKIKILLSVGADIFARNSYGFTLFDARRVNAKYVLLLLKALALKRACLPPSIVSKDERIIETIYPEHWNRYQDYIDELRRTKSARFIETCTMFELLTKCQCQIAPLMRHHQFGIKFRQYDLSAFPVYYEDIVEAFKIAKLYYHSMLDQEDVINEAVCNILPHVVVRKVVDHVFNNCEICEMKNIVQASRDPPGDSDTEDDSDSEDDSDNED